MRHSSRTAGHVEKEDDYRKTLELQKQKDSMNAEEEITKKFRK